MIVNHKYKFIYLKTLKTASTSIEIALSKFCGPDDIITPISEKDEENRKNRSYRGQQNCRVPRSFYKTADYLNLLFKKEFKLFENHSTASFIRSNIDKEIWDNYFKFTFERNPFDKAVSSYFYFREKLNQPDTGINDFLQSCLTRRLSNWDIYTINDHIAVDFIGRYENLIPDLEKIADIVGLPDKIKLPIAKTGFRPNHTSYKALLDDKARCRIGRVNAKEIQTFDYQW